MSSFSLTNGNADVSTVENFSSVAISDRLAHLELRWREDLTQDAAGGIARANQEYGNGVPVHSQEFRSGSVDGGGNLSRIIMVDPACGVFSSFSRCPCSRRIT